MLGFLRGRIDVIFYMHPQVLVTYSNRQGQNSVSLLIFTGVAVVPRPQLPPDVFHLLI